MDISQHFSQAMANLLSSKMRSFLAVLGILVGTASVVALVTSGELATQKALAQFKALGTDLLAVALYQKSSKNISTSANTLTVDDWDEMAQSIPGILRIAPYTTMYKDIAFRGRKIKGSIIGADDNLKDVVKIGAAEGGFVSFLDTNEKYCFIGKKIEKQLQKYTRDSLIGQQLWLGKNIYTIIGTARYWEENAFFNEDVNKAVFIPIRGSAMISTDAQIHNVIIQLKADASIDKVMASIRAFIEKRAPEVSVFPRSAKQLIKSMQSQGQIFTLLLGLIGGISLLVGGIGVMNVMLVSVVERRREIGIRMAIGAKRKDIHLLFLIESVVLSLFGGLLGIVIGLIVSYIISYFSEWSFSFFLEPPLIGFAVSVATGIFFGFYPAYRASQLNPIETLRSD